jgi:hypothetical protein
MISTVEKIYSDEGEFLTYNVVFIDGKTSSVPHNEENRHYQEILEWVANGGTIIDNGA